MAQFKIERDSKGRCQKYAWPGGYPLFYLCADNGILCPDCVDKERALIEQAEKDCPDDNQWRIVACEVNWEDDSLYCDNCSQTIESAYGEEEA